MNILFSAFINPLRKSGVEKKIDGQIKAFENLGHNVWYFTFSGDKILLCHKDESKELFSVSANPVGYYMALQKGMRYAAEKLDIDMVYIRRIFCSPFHLKTLDLFRKKGIITIEEIPTYPYDELNRHYTAASYKIAAVVDKIYRRQYHSYLDRFVTFSKHTEIFGVPAICLDNGVNFDTVRFIPTVFPDDRLDMIAVSAMSPCHGYERAIEGIKNYMETNPSVPVYLHLVGDGQERANWEALTDKYNLRDYVIFHGHRTGDELHSIFDRCQIGLSILGMYKMGMEAVSPLKTREYAAMGKPFVYANTELNIDETTPFCMRIANDATPLDINAVLQFYSRVKEIPQICETMNSFAKEHYSWEAQMAEVVRCAESLR
ncbi:MAG: glycosyltransferase family 4 protein [Oscillospiraceae bacterium]|nr:glycosyltransferase family 4 protein [Oscillospiraceae bacterium]